jgi:hypothetical protein
MRVSDLDRLGAKLNQFDPFRPLADLLISPDTPAERK